MTRRPRTASPEQKSKLEEKKVVGRRKKWLYSTLHVLLFVVLCHVNHIPGGGGRGEDLPCHGQNVSMGQKPAAKVKGINRPGRDSAGTKSPGYTIGSGGRCRLKGNGGGLQPKQRRQPHKK